MSAFDLNQRAAWLFYKFFMRALLQKLLERGGVVSYTLQRYEHCHSQAIGAVSQAQPRSLPTLEGGGKTESGEYLVENGWNLLLIVLIWATICHHFFSHFSGSYLSGRSLDTHSASRFFVFFVLRFHSVAW